MIKYDKYKDSGVEWLGTIPEHWIINRLKDLGMLRFSNVDKKTKEGQLSVLLCNYVDVYKNDYIDNSIDFMLSSASLSEMQRFTLQVGDIMFTKDSESFDDIANSAMVIEKLKNVVCGYHLAHFRGNNKVVNSNYINRLLQSIDYNYWFKINATGITRVGLGIIPITNAHTPVPPMQEQKAIADYLDTKTKAIDKKVSLLHKKTDYYKELRKSIINDAVTKGLDKNVELKETEIGIQVPTKWKRYRLKDIGKLYSGLSGKSGDDFRKENNPHNKGYIPFTNIANNTYIVDDNINSVVIDPFENQNRVRKDDLFFLMSSEGYEDIGKSSVLAMDFEETYLNSFCKGYRLRSDKYNSHFINYLLLSDSYRQLLIVEGKGFTRINLKMEKVNDFIIHIPPTRKEQNLIVDYLDNKTASIDSILKNIKQQIKKLKELRKTLINDVVTGKIKVV